MSLDRENINLDKIESEKVVMGNGIPDEHIFYMRGQGTENVQSIIQQDLFEDDDNSSNDMLELLQFMRSNSISLTDDQAKGMFLLHEYGLDDISEFVLGVRPLLTPQKTYFDTINKITLADRIKGTAKLDKLLKAQVASPSQQVPNASDLQPKAMKESDLKR
ncbi:hypothetical protein PDK24_28170 [Bacillus cereus]|uniref:hypothetical protein n=1 Tax=Bacillus cereus group TaxID=86661 RepID=UPI001C72FAA1|nr:MULTISPECIES: hypothetical protein [Bacillus cereus group]MBX0351817.1 hypothetical protein [Bacillus toyonensis]MDA1909646.1 hypothetical protein [Bacillus cereus]MDA2716772.1 hypothetical protein [Bacillus cereus group sp. Bc025]